jgi:hypothetical protein
MSRPISVQALTDELVRRQLIGSSPSTTVAAANDRPWFIGVVLGFSGWLAGTFVLAFVAMLFKPESPASIAFSGLILLAAAFGLYAADQNNEFFDQLALALSIAGQFAVVWAASEATDSAAATAALAAVMQVALLFVMPNDLAKVLAAFFACCAWALAIRFTWWGEPDFDNARQQVALAPALLGWLVVWTPILGAVHMLVTKEHVWMAHALRRVARAALSGLLVSLCVATWVSEPLASLTFWEGESQARTSWLVLWPLLGAASALCASLYAFRLRSRAMIGVAIAGALLHVGQFYYLLGTTLMIKSSIMIAVGVAALLAATWLRRQGVQQEVKAP